MKHVFHLRREITEFQKNLFFEILKSERIRVLLVILVLIMTAFAGGIIKTMLMHGADNVGQIIGNNISIHFLVLVVAGAILYEVLIFFLLNFIIRKRIRIPDGPRFGNAFFEVSLVTLGLIFFARSINPIISINSPFFLVYFFLIILSTLRLGFALSLFTGLVAGLEYFFTVSYFIPRITTPADPYFYSILPYIGKSAVLTGSGVIAGLVSQQIRKRLVDTLTALSDRNRIVNMFGQYVSPAVVEKLISQTTEFKGEVRHVTIMFLDIRNFTKFSEKKTPEEVVEYLNKLFEHLIHIVNQNNGIINKFLGDGFMAVFGAPLSDGRDVQNAVKAGLEIVAKIQDMNDKGEIEPTRIGIGMHSGPAITGNVGSEERKEYTIIGDTVNLASRVEQLNKEFKSTFLVTSSVIEAAPGICECVELPPVKVKGREEEVRIFKLI